MMDLRKHVTLTRLLALLLSVLGPMTRVAAQNSGKVGAVNQDATGTPARRWRHTLVVGAGVVYKETIKTAAQGLRVAPAFVRDSIEIILRKPAAVDVHTMGKPPRSAEELDAIVRPFIP